MIRNSRTAPRAAITSSRSCRHSLRICGRCGPIVIVKVLRSADGTLVWLFAALSFYDCHMLCKQRELLARQKSQFHPAKEVVHDRLCISKFLITGPARGLETSMRELVADHLERYSVLQLTETTVPKHSINPAIVEPSFAIRMKISPGCPFG